MPTYTLNIDNDHVSHWLVMLKPAGSGQPQSQRSKRHKCSGPTLPFTHCSTREQRKLAQGSFYETFQLSRPVAPWPHEVICQTAIFSGCSVG